MAAGASPLHRQAAAAHRYARRWGSAGLLAIDDVRRMAIGAGIFTLPVAHGRDGSLELHPLNHSRQGRHYFLLHDPRRGGHSSLPHLPLSVLDLAAQPSFSNQSSPSSGSFAILAQSASLVASGSSYCEIQSLLSGARANITRPAQRSSGSKSKIP
jgi:hypothetical protein